MEREPWLTARPPESTVRVLSKLQRAYVHLNLLERRLNRFLDHKPYRFWREVNADATEHVFRVQVRRAVPVSCAVIAGDFLHDVRSALDHLAHEVVRANGQTPTAKTGFPIYYSRLLYQERAPRQTAGMPLKAVQRIERLQPYHRGNEKAAKRDLLWILHDLNVIDKHRELNLAGTVINRVESLKGPGDPPPNLVTPIGYLKHGQVVLRLTFPTPQPDAQFDADFEPAVVFDEGSNLPYVRVIDLLREIHQRVLLIFLSDFTDLLP